MPKVTITTNDGEVVEVLEADGYNFDKPIAYGLFTSEVVEAVQRAELIEKGE